RTRCWQSWSAAPGRLGRAFDAHVGGPVEQLRCGVREPVAQFFRKDARVLNAAVSAILPNSFSGSNVAVGLPSKLTFEALDEIVRVRERGAVRGDRATTLVLNGADQVRLRGLRVVVLGQFNVGPRDAGFR